MKLTKTRLPRGYTKYDAFVWWSNNMASVYVKKPLTHYFGRFRHYASPSNQYKIVGFVREVTAERVMNTALPQDYLNKTINFIKKEREETENASKA